MYKHAKPRPSWHVCPPSAPSFPYSAPRRHRCTLPKQLYPLVRLPYATFGRYLPAAYVLLSTQTVILWHLAPPKLSPESSLSTSVVVVVVDSERHYTHNSPKHLQIGVLVSPQTVHSTIYITSFPEGQQTNPRSKNVDLGRHAGS